MSAQKALTSQSDKKNYQGLPEMSHEENPSFVPAQPENVQPVGTPEALSVQKVETAADQK